ncbi:MAG: hypothetical protein KAJ40_06670 [Alphaproteobacteria bacterium]|nr:hypothetical protein [Alphaproteobacteria bacterium]
MSAAILKALKWYLMAIAIIVGASAFTAANETGDILPWIVVVIGFGSVYIMSYVWSKFRGKILLISFIVFVALTVLSSYTVYFFYIFFEVNLLSVSSYLIWSMTMLLGIPVMAGTFKYIDD